jgi:2Fe-2S ferredoxin
MEAAVKNDVPGIVAECGGFLACATCHVYVDHLWLERVGKAGEKLGEMEDEMLDNAMSERLVGSRLSCQILMTEELDGLTVRIAPEQT